MTGAARNGDGRAARLDSIAACLLCAALVAAPWFVGTFATPPRLQGVLPGASETYGPVLAMACIAASALVLAWREHRWPVRLGGAPYAGPLLVGLVAWIVLTSLRSPVPWMTLNFDAALAAAVLVAVCAARLGRVSGLLAGLTVAVATAGTLAACAGLREYIEFLRMGVPGHRIFGTFVNPDFLAGYLLLTLPVTLTGVVAGRRPASQVLMGVGVAVQSAALLLTGSRAGAGAAIVMAATWGLLVAGAIRGRNLRWRAVIALAIMLAFAAAASGPTRLRVADRGNTRSDARSPALTVAGDHSAAFRRYTWLGTVKMIRANPILGTGPGSYEVAYPRYALTAFTAHAHDAYLQFTSESGIPGVAVLLALLAALAAFAAHGWLALRSTPQAVEANSPDWLRADLVLPGYMAAMIGTVVHALADSDWYNVAILLTVGAICGCMTAAARGLRPAPGADRRPLSPGVLGALAAAALFVCWRTAASSAARSGLAAGEVEAATGQAGAAVDAMEGARSADPLDPEPRLGLALLHVASGHADAAAADLNGAIAVASMGKCWYRLGQFRTAVHDAPGAVSAFEHARALEPRNVQNLVALARALAAAGQPSAATQVWRELADLELEPYGRVRAVPEMVETAFAVAHAALADDAVQRRAWPEAQAQCRAALAVLREFWQRYQADPDIAGQIGTSKRTETEALTNHVYDVEIAAARGLHEPLGPISAEAEAFRAARAHEPAGPSTSGP